MIRDDYQFETWNYIISALESDDELGFNKYLSVNAVLEDYSWGPCAEIDHIKKIIEKDAAWWSDFWAQPNAEEIFKMNRESKSTRIADAIEDLSRSWGNAQAVEAGRAYGRFWALQIGRPDAWEGATQTEL